MSDISKDYLNAKLVADGLLRQQGHDPSAVYAFLDSLEGAPDITDVGFENIRRHIIGATVTAKYTGGDNDEYWGEINERDNIASDNFRAVAQTIFGDLAAHTGYEVYQVGANVKPAYCHARVKLGKENLLMKIKKE